MVAIWTKTTPLGDDIDWMSQMIIEATIEPPARHNYEQLAEEVARKVPGHIPSLARELDNRRLPGTFHSFQFEAYARSLVHDEIRSEIDIRLGSNDSSLMITFVGQEAETYELRHH